MTKMVTPYTWEQEVRERNTDGNVKAGQSEKSNFRAFRPQVGDNRPELRPLKTQCDPASRKRARGREKKGGGGEPRWKPTKSAKKLRTEYEKQKGGTFLSPTNAERIPIPDGKG